MGEQFIVYILWWVVSLEGALRQPGKHIYAGYVIIKSLPYE